jgi:hypothetical protein
MEDSGLLPLIPIVSTFMFFSTIILLVLVPRWFKSREREALQATLKAAIERGQPLPPEVIDAITREQRPVQSPARDVRTAVIWLGIAAGMIGFAYALGYDENAADAFWPLVGISAFPGFVGISFLINALLSRNTGKR